MFPRIKAWKHRLIVLFTRVEKTKIFRLPVAPAQHPGVMKLLVSGAGPSRFSDSLCAASRQSRQWERQLTIIMLFYSSRLSGLNLCYCYI